MDPSVSRSDCGCKPLYLIYATRFLRRAVKQRTIKQIAPFELRHQTPLGNNRLSDELSIFSLSRAKQKLAMIVPGERVILAETYDHYLFTCWYGVSASVCSFIHQSEADRRQDLSRLRVFGLMATATTDIWGQNNVFFSVNIYLAKVFIKLCIQLICCFSVLSYLEIRRFYIVWLFREFR